MTSQEIFREVVKSPIFQDVFNIPQNELDKLEFSTEISQYEVIEIIKAIIRGKFNNSDSSAIFKYIQNQILQL